MTETAAAAAVRILHRDSQLLMLYKPAGLATTSPTGKDCLTEVAAALDPSAPQLHASSRLDAEVTGVVTFARTSLAIQGLLDARRDGLYERFYLGLAASAPAPAEGEWHWAIDNDPRDRRKRIAVEPGNGKHKQALAASSRYRVLATQPTAAALLLMPQTGRTHQLRVHAARAGAALLGDKHYGGLTQCTLPDGRVLRAARVMLHCARVSLPNLAAADGSQLTVEAPLPDDFLRLWSQLGGSAAQLLTTQSRESTLVASRRDS